MTKIMSETQQLADRIGDLVSHSMPDAGSVKIGSLARIFGGNARIAWSFDLEINRAGETVCMPCVMLSQAAGRQVESDVREEFRILACLNGKQVRAPAAIALDGDGNFVGAPSIVLERLPGKTNAVELLKVLPADNARSISRDLAGVSAKLHQVDWAPAAFDPALDGLSPSEVAARQISYWEGRFREARLEPLPVLSALFGWLRQNLPVPRRLSLVHGDLRPGNFLYTDDRVTGLLDWEMAHLGDPLEDIGWIYRPLWSPAQRFGIEEFLEEYEKRSNHAVSRRDMLYYRIFSEVKFAVISLAAAKAFASGATSNIRHADRAAMIAPCMRRGLDWIEQHRKGVHHV